jgi:hypothetical protein
LKQNVQTNPITGTEKEREREREKVDGKKARVSRPPFPVAGIVPRAKKKRASERTPQVLEREQDLDLVVERLGDLGDGALLDVVHDGEVGQEGLDPHERHQHRCPQQQADGVEAVPRLERLRRGRVVGTVLCAFVFSSLGIVRPRRRQQGGGGGGGGRVVVRGQRRHREGVVPEQDLVIQRAAPGSCRRGRGLLAEALAAASSSRSPRGGAAAAHA